MTIRARSSIGRRPFARPRTPTTASSVISRSSTANPSRTSTPDSAAAFTSRLSSTVRRGQKPPLPSFASGIVPCSANGPTSNVIRRQMGGTPVLASRWRRPQRARTSAPCGHRMCVEIVSLGKVALSTSNTLNPRRASSMAVGEPAHRAPTMIASYIGTSARDRAYRDPKRSGIGQDYPKSWLAEKWVILCTPRQMRLCWYAQAVAAARLETPTLSKILLTWRATVFSLMNSSSAMARFVLPAASRRRTCTSRSLSEPIESDACACRWLGDAREARRRR